MASVLIVPGLGGSGPHHWQTHLERWFQGASRVHQDDWDQPDRAAWTDRLTTAIMASPDAVLVAHSLGCAVVAHVAARRPDLPVAAALLVAPADVDRGDCEPDRLRRFAPMPRMPLPFRSIVMASTNDPYMTLGRAHALAKDWGASFVNAGALGHINVDSGFGPWREGAQVLEQLITEQCRPPRHAIVGLPLSDTALRTDGA
jgi:uncharacterized protein